MDDKTKELLFERYYRGTNTEESNIELDLASPLQNSSFMLITERFLLIVNLERNDDYTCVSVSFVEKALCGVFSFWESLAAYEMI